MRRAIRAQAAWVLAPALLSAFLACPTSAVKAYTPESPQVKTMVDRAVKYLEKTQPHGELGGKALQALAIYKHNNNSKHPKVVEAVAACKAQAASGAAPTGAIYSLGAAIVFMCEVGPQEYAADITALLTQLLAVQKSHGGWGYTYQLTGDTSQTQYGVLAIWSAYYSEQQVPIEAADAVCNWLLRTQDPTGAWGYQGNDPGLYERVQQTPLTLSLTAAGLGSTYITAHLLGFVKAKSGEGQGEDNLGMPALQKKNKEAVAAKGVISKSVDRAVLEKALVDGNNWMSTNFNINSGNWTHYYLYALERYCSFRDEVEGRHEKEPAWYNQGVEFLKSGQAENGSWQGIGHAGPDVDTAFGVLFLLRGALKTIQRVTLSQGNLLAGQGLPADVATARLRGAQVVAAQVTRSVDDFLALLEDPDSPDVDALMHEHTKISLADDKRTRTQQTNRLRGLVREGTFEQRVAAVKALGTARDIDNAPLLIYALTDPDWRVAKEAHKALCFIGRKFDPAPEEKPPGPLFDAYINGWKTWCLSVRPDAEFID